MSLITLVKPPAVMPRWAIAGSTCPPIGLAYIASSLKKAGYEVDVIDAIGESIFQMIPVPNHSHLLAHGLSLDQIVERVNPLTDFIGISCMFSHGWPLTRELVKKLKARFSNRPIIGGGEHITCLKEWILKTCPEMDYCILGEGEEKIVELVKMLSAGKTPSNINGVLSHDTPLRPWHEGPIDFGLMKQRIRDIDSIPPPAWELFPISSYLDNEFGFGVNRGRSMPMLATRGCPYQCMFCSSPQMWTTKWIARDPVKVVDEMENYLHLYQVKNFDFCDLTTIIKKEWVVAFCKLILKRGYKFTWQLPSGTRSESIDDEVADLLFQSGCRNLSYAPESGSPEVLKRIKKMVNLNKMKASMRSCIKNGLNVKCNIILGFPEETHFEVWQTMKFIVKIALLGIHDISIATYSPYPGSELFNGLQRAGKISEFSDEYFWSSSIYSGVADTVSFSNYISNRMLGFYRIFGILFFYILSYTIRPWRLFITLCNVFKSRQESRLEMVIRNTLVKLFSVRGIRTISK